MVGFSEELRRQADSIWDAIFQHPFLQELKAGTLPVEKFRYFLGQDWHYLDAFARTVAQAISKAEDPLTLEHLTEAAPPQAV